jgi:hypothetical protein
MNEALWSWLLPTLRVEDQRSERVVIGLELRLDPIEKTLHRPGLRLGGSARPTVGQAGLDRRRALLIVCEVLIEVTFRVDTVDTRDLTVAVVVAQVLAPQPLVVERVLVAVRIGAHVWEKNTMMTTVR